MPALKIAIMVHNLKMDIYDGLAFAARMEIPGVHLACVRGFSHRDLDSAGRKQLLQHLRSLGLEISAICAWGGEVDLGRPDNLRQHIEDAKQILQYAADMECGIWQGHCGIIPHSRQDPAWQRFVDSLGEICQHGEKVGARLAVETGPEPPAVLMDMIHDVGSSALCVNYDPANLILWPAKYMQQAGQPYDREQAFAEYQPMEGVKVLGDRIIHTHAKDALVQADGKRLEVPLGSGWIDWPRYVQNLRDIGYQGYFAVEREVGDDPVGDITRAVNYLKTL